MLVPFKALLLSLTVSVTIASPLDPRISKCTTQDAEKRRPCKTDQCLLTIGTLVEVCETGTCVFEFRGPYRVSGIDEAG